ncbi:hypothetical protein [Schlesneria sp. DSM 10557]|uniref:hypothetical protein n=1 Tax=Schlesneria sp. DSM 10557 TaxID=3044399 RepID=UPI0035A13EB6
MNHRETAIWTFLFLAGGLALVVRAVYSEAGVGQKYVVPVEVVGQINPGTQDIIPVEAGEAVDSGNMVKSVRYDKAAKDQVNAVWSPSRTIGVWTAALLTLCIFSYLYRDNLFYKLAESIIVGVSAGYWIVLNFWEVLVAKVLVKLAPDVASYAFVPDIPVKTLPDYGYVIPVILGGLVFCRWIPKLTWLGRWPLAFVVGTTAGLKLLLFLNADFVQQVRSTILPLIVFSEQGAFDWKQSVQNAVIVVSVVASLCYFYFSVEHKGLFGRLSRFGIWVLMISFGASFALTVMGRITLLTMRLQFLFDDWLGFVKM